MYPGFWEYFWLFGGGFILYRLLLFRSCLSVMSGNTAGFLLSKNDLDNINGTSRTATSNEIKINDILDTNKTQQEQIDTSTKNVTELIYTHEIQQVKIDVANRRLTEVESDMFAGVEATLKCKDSVNKLQEALNGINKRQFELLDTLALMQLSHGTRHAAVLQKISKLKKRIYELEHPKTDE